MDIGSSSMLLASSRDSSSSSSSEEEREVPPPKKLRASTPKVSRKQLKYRTPSKSSSRKYQKIMGKRLYMARARC